MKKHDAKPGPFPRFSSLISAGPLITSEDRERLKDFRPRLTPIAAAVHYAFPPQRLKAPRYIAPSEIRHSFRQRLLNAAGRLRGWVVTSPRLRVRALSKDRQDRSEKGRSRPALSSLRARLGAPQQSTAAMGTRQT